MTLTTVKYRIGMSTELHTGTVAKTVLCKCLHGKKMVVVVLICGRILPLSSCLFHLDLDKKNAQAPDSSITAVAGEIGSTFDPIRVPGVFPANCAAETICDHI